MARYPPLSVARHAFSVLVAATSASLRKAMDDPLLAADGSWLVRPGLASASCAAPGSEVSSP